MREYTETLIFRLRPKQKEMIRERMQQLGVSNMSAYIRKMTLNGPIILLDLSELCAVIDTLKVLADHVNEFTKRANATGRIYPEDIQEIKDGQKKILKILAKLNADLERVNRISNEIFKYSASLYDA